MAASRKSAPPRSTPAKPAQPILQWTMAAIGAAVTLAVIAVIGAETMRPERPADLSARLVAVHTARAGWVAEVEVRNSGLDTAAAVQIEAAHGGQTAKATLDYVPGEGQATAYLPFAGAARDPAPVVTVRGWSEP